MSWLLENPGEVAFRTAQHLQLTLTALALALAIALPLGVLAARDRRLGRPLLAALGVLYTLPSLAVFALLIPLFGLGFWTALIALVAYAQMILVRNVAVAIEGVPLAMREAARGLGMSPLQSLWRVELPQALPVIVGGIRIATVSLIAIANLAAWIDAGGLGVLLFAGLRSDDTGKIVAGSLASALLAICADLGLRALERRLARRSG
ncbi:MAG TPA: ABC transporter permease [Candidatus Baltobacteraceae bacterium]|nr:ABC transporter permease [Candidatus Baltobacteraceae bacterium]